MRGNHFLSWILSGLQTKWAIHAFVAHFVCSQSFSHTSRGIHRFLYPSLYVCSSQFLTSRKVIPHASLSIASLHIFFFYKIISKVLIIAFFRAFTFALLNCSTVVLNFSSHISITFLFFVSRWFVFISFP